MSRHFYNVGNISVRLTKMENRKTEKCKNFEHFMIGPVQSQIEKCPVTLKISETFQFAWQKLWYQSLKNQKPKKSVQSQASWTFHNQTRPKPNRKMSSHFDNVGNISVRLKKMENYEFGKSRNLKTQKNRRRKSFFKVENLKNVQHSGLQKRHFGSWILLS